MVDSERVTAQKALHEKHLLLQEVERRNTACLKWDGLEARFGDPDLIAMWVADMEFEAPRVVIDALHDRVEHGAFGYHLTPASYHEAFIGWENEHFGYDVKPEWIHYAPGVVSAIYWLVDMLTGPGDACLVLSPVYSPFYSAVRDKGRTLVCCDLKNTGGFYTVDFDQFEADIVENDVKLFILCSPHNPVGRVWTGGELKKMWEICKRHHVFILSDEIHQDIVTGPNRHLPMALVADDDALLITLTSASKTFNLASLGTYLLWCDLRALIPEERLVRFMQEICGVAVNYGIWFGDGGRGFIRINLATPRWRVEEVVRRMVAAAHLTRGNGDA